MKQYENRPLKPYEKVIYKYEQAGEWMGSPYYHDVPYIYDINSMRFKDGVSVEEVKNQYIEHYGVPPAPMVEIKYQTKDGNEGAMLIHSHVFNKLSKAKVNKLMKLVSGKVS